MGKKQKGQKEEEKDNRYDKIIKENLEAVFLPLVEKYLDFKIVASELLEAKLQSTIEREVDFLRIVKTDQGEEFILHLEFQSNNEGDMIYRIKEYDAIIQRKYKRKYKPRLDIRHYVIFLGKGRMSMKTHLPENHVFRHFGVLSLNKLDFEQMMQSQIPEEIILAILSDFKGKDPEKILELITKKLMECTDNKSKLRKFVKQLKVLSKLRTLENKTVKIIKNMPITYNLKEDYSYKMGMEEGRELERKKADAELEKQQRKAIVAMLVLGNKPEQIAEHLEMPVEFVTKIQEELN